MVLLRYGSDAPSPLGGDPLSLAKLPCPQDNAGCSAFFVPSMDTSDSQIAKRAAEYREFISLYDPYPQLMNPPLPPGGEIRLETADKGDWVPDLHKAVYGSPYLRRLQSVNLPVLFANLEKLLAKPDGRILVDACLPPDAQAIGRRKRELRFLRRYAEIIRYDGAELPLPKPVETRKERARFARRCRLLEARLQQLMEDEFLTESLGRYSLLEARRLGPTLARLAAVIDDIKPYYPFERERDKERAAAKAFIHFFVSCCFRTYGCCSAAVIERMFYVPWLSIYAEATPDMLGPLINEAIKQEGVSYRHRVAEAPWDFALFPEDWEPPTTD